MECRQKHVFLAGRAKRKAEDVKNPPGKRRKRMVTEPLRRRWLQRFPWLILRNGVGLCKCCSSFHTTEIVKKTFTQHEDWDLNQTRMDLLNFNRVNHELSAFCRPVSFPLRVRLATGRQLPSSPAWNFWISKVSHLWKISKSFWGRRSDATACGHQSSGGWRASRWLGVSVKLSWHYIDNGARRCSLAPSAKTVKVFWWD